MWAFRLSRVQLVLFVQQDVDPEIVLTNYGGNTVTSIDIEYQIDAGPVSTFNWTGNLTQGQSVTL